MPQNEKKLSYILIYSNVLCILIIIILCYDSEDRHAFHPLNILDQAKADTILAEAIALFEERSNNIGDTVKHTKINIQYYLDWVKSSTYIIDSFYQNIPDSCHNTYIQSYYVLFYYPMKGLPPIPIKNIGYVFCLKIEKDLSKNTVNSILIFETGGGGNLEHYRKLFWKVINGKKLPKQDSTKSSLKINELYIE